MITISPCHQCHHLLFSTRGFILAPLAISKLGFDDLKHQINGIAKPLTNGRSFRRSKEEVLAYRPYRGVKDPEDLRVLYKEEVHMPQVPTIIFSE
jgi:hypothetical protein